MCCMSFFLSFKFFYLFIYNLPLCHSGRNYDKNGDMTDWWSPSSSQKFQELSQCIVEQYGSFSWDLANGQNVCNVILYSFHCGEHIKHVDRTREHLLFSLSSPQSSPAENTVMYEAHIC